MSAASASIAPAEVLWIAGDEAERPPLDPDERGDDAESEGRAQLQNRVFVRERLDHRADVVDAQPVLRDQATQPPLVRGCPCGDPALEICEISLRRRRRLGLVLDHDVDDAVRRLNGDRSHLLRADDPQAPALDHGRAAHADRGTLRRDDHVAAAEQRGVAGEAAARGDADQRREAAEPRELREGRHVEARDAEALRVARPPAAALGEQDDRQPLLLGELERRSCFLWLRAPCVPASTV